VEESCRLWVKDCQVWEYIALMNPIVQVAHSHSMQVQLSKDQEEQQVLVVPVEVDQSPLRVQDRQRPVNQPHLCPSLWSLVTGLY